MGKLKPIWEEVSSDLYGQVNVGVVNGEKNERLSRRFMISSYPTLMLMKSGQLYVYNGGQLTRKSLVDFAVKGYKIREKLLVDPMEVPPPETNRGRFLRILVGAVLYTPI